MDLVVTVFLLPFAIYGLGMLTAKLAVPRVPALQDWLKKVQQKNVPMSICLLSQSCRQRVWFIGSGNLVFGLLLTVSGIILGLPPLLLIFRSSLMAWGIANSRAVVIGLSRIHLPYRALTVVESIIFSVWAGLGVELGLCLIALVSGWNEVLTQQRSWLPVLPGLVLGMLALLAACAFAEAYAMGSVKDVVIREFFQKTPAVPSQHETILAVETRAPTARAP